MKKGFTLIELLAVIIILAIIALIAIPSMIGIMDYVKESAFERQKEFILDAAKLYVFNKPEVNELGYVTLKELIENNYIEAGIKDNKGNIIDDTYIVSLESKELVTTTKYQGESIVVSNSIGAPISKLVVYGKSEQNIPSGYTFYDYISLDGAQYIDSAIIPTYNTTVEIDCAISAIGKWLFGSRLVSAVSTDKFGVYVTSSTNMYPQYNGQDNSNIVISNTLVRAKHKLSKNEYYIDGVKKYTFTQNNFNGTNSLYIGGMHQGTIDTRNFSGKVYKVRMWQGNTLVRNYIPVKRNSDNVIGLYDLVNNVFYMNIGTGSFTVGNEITFFSPSYPSELNSVNNFDLITSSSSQSNTLSFPYTLRSLPNGIRDRIEVDNINKTAKLYQNIGVKEFAGTETIVLQSTNSNGIANYLFYLTGATNTNNIFFSHFKKQTTVIADTLTEGYLGQTNTAIYIRIYSSTASSVDAFKTWLSGQYSTGTPVTIEYELETPIVTDLDYNLYKNIITYKGVTNVYKTGLKSNMEVEIYTNN